MRRAWLILLLTLIAITHTSCQDDTTNTETDATANEDASTAEGEGQDGNKEGEEACGCAAANRGNVEPIEGTSEAASEEEEDASVETVEEEDEKVSAKEAAAKYTSAANAQSSYPRTNQMAEIKVSKQILQYVFFIIRQCDRFSRLEKKKKIIKIYFYILFNEETSFHEVLFPTSITSSLISLNGQCH